MRTTTVSRVIAIVVGYLVAAVLGAAAVGLRTATSHLPDAEASGGMAAFGDALLFLAVFGVIALIPTGGVLVLLRSYRRFWVGLASAAALFAVTGLAAMAIFAIGGGAAESSPMIIWAGIAVLRFLVAPLFAVLFLIAGFLATFPGPRRTLLWCAGIEVAVFAYGALAWFVPSALEMSR